MLVGGGAQQAGVLHGLAVIVDGAGADHDDQAVVAAVQHVGDLGPAAFDQRLDLVRDRQFVLQQRGRDQRRTAAMRVSSMRVMSWVESAAPTSRSCRGSSMRVKGSSVP